MLGTAAVQGTGGRGLKGLDACGTWRGRSRTPLGLRPASRPRPGPGTYLEAADDEQRVEAVLADLGGDLLQVLPRERPERSGPRSDTVPPPASPRPPAQPRGTEPPPTGEPLTAAVTSQRAFSKESGKQPDSCPRPPGLAGDRDDDRAAHTRSACHREGRPQARTSSRDRWHHTHSRCRPPAPSPTPNTADQRDCADGGCPSGPCARAWPAGGGVCAGQA